MTHEPHGLAPSPDPLTQVAVETERYVAAAGWDQPARLFALVPTRELLKAEPRIAAEIDEGDGLSAVEQEDLPPGPDLETVLGRIAWPASVAGVALSVERLVVPPEAELDLPAGVDEALATLSAHPGRRDVRLLVAVDRLGGSCCLLRQRAHDSDDLVGRGPDLAPGLTSALAATLA